MWKRVALLVAIAALTIVKPSNSVAQAWDGFDRDGFDRDDFDRDGFDGFDGFRRGAVTVTVSFPHRRFPCCERRFFPRRVFCCERPFIPRPVFCCGRRFFRPFFRPPYYYGDRFAPYAYNWNAGYGYGGYGGW